MKGMKYPPFAKPVPMAKPVEAHAVAEPALIEELPSIDEFLDELPPIDDFLAAELPEIAPEEIAAVSEAAIVQNEERPVEGWAPGDWQSYDWSALSRLATPVAPQRAVAEITSSSGDEVADALEGIARRIRSGELLIDNLRETPPEAAMAAALAIVLRMRG